MSNFIRGVKLAGDYARQFIAQDGQYIRKETQDLGPAIQHVKKIRDMHEHATAASNRGEWRHTGSIPMTVLIDWLNAHRYTMDQCARNEGGIPGKKYPYSKSGVKDKFLAYFLSRKFSKLHNEHVTTKRNRSQILMPGAQHGDNKPAGT